MTSVTALQSASQETNRVFEEDRPVHDWYRFVLSFPPHLVRTYVSRFGVEPGQTVLDPFCGTGTTLVECKKLGIASIGIEPNPMAHFASSVKTDWSPDPDRLLRHASRIAKETERLLPSFSDASLPLFQGRGQKATDNLKRLPPEKTQLLLANSISELPLHRTLTLLEQLERRGDPSFLKHERLALAKAVVTRISNLHFGPEVGVGRPKDDAPAVEYWLESVGRISADLTALKVHRSATSKVHLNDSRNLEAIIQPSSIDAVITSPPYPNEKDYTRTTRLESVLLGFLRNKDDLKRLKQNLIRSNTRNVYVADTDDAWVAEHSTIQDIAAQIEKRRQDLGKTSGFERLYHRVTKLYFGGMTRHLESLRVILKPGARLAYVVGDQASYLRVMIRTGELLADIAQGLGYRVIDIDLFRTRLATATKEQLREEVVVLEWPGVSRKRHSLPSRSRPRA